MADAIVSTCGTWDVVWPYPQVFYGKYYTLVFAIVATTGDCSAGFPAADGNLVMFELVNDANIWTATAMYDFGNASYIDQLDVMDFGQFYTASAFGYNGATAVHTTIRRNPGEAEPLITALPSTKSPAFITGCNFNGQAVVGGISSTDANWNSLGLPGVAWSSIGYFDFRPYDANNVAGYRRMPWENGGKGIVYKVHQIGKGVLVLGDGGQALLYPVSEPVVTFGMKHLAGSGIRSGNHVAGDDTIVAWIDRNYDLWIMKSDMSSEKLGYREYMKTLVTHANRTLMSYVPSKKRFYISNGDESYVLTEHGLYTTDQLITSAGDYKGTLCGFWADGDDVEIRFGTDRLDFDAQGLKTFEGAEFGIHYNAAGSALSAAIEYLYDYNTTSFSSMDWQELSPLAQLTQRVTAREFRLKLKGTTYKNATFNFDSILAKIKFPDKRSTRGLMR